MALLKPGFVGQAGSGQLAAVDSGPDVRTQFVLQVMESHASLGVSWQLYFLKAIHVL
jgi:hypothetical protein